MTRVRRNSVNRRDRDPRRPQVGLRASTLRLALFLAACSLTLSLWVPGFHHHAAGNESADCTVCLTVGAQSSDLPTVVAALDVPAPTDACSLFEQTSPRATDAADDSESPRGPPLT
jgi:hypothetical protein